MTLENLLTKEQLTQEGYRYTKLGKAKYMIKEIKGNLIAYKEVRSNQYELHAEYVRRDV
jgi:hypothetical protein